MGARSFLFLTAAVAAAALRAADVLDGASLSWRVGAYAQITNGVAIFDVPAGQTNVTAFVTADVDLGAVCGRDGYEASVRMRGRDVSEPAVPWGGGKAFTLLGLQDECARAVREIDPVTPIVFEPNNNGQETGYEFVSPLRMDNVIYSVHVYDPIAYTHQGLSADKAKYHPEPWPNAEKGWNREYLRRKLQPVRDFQLRTGARILVGEFSSVAYAPGANNYLEDVLSLFREYGWDWTYHAFREASCWSMEHEAESYFELAPSATKTPRAVLLEDYMRHGAVDGIRRRAVKN